MNLKRLALAACASLAALACAIPASAQGLSQFQTTGNTNDLGMVQATAGTTFATTSYADLTGATITFTPKRSPTATEAPGTPTPTENLLIWWSLDASKATTLTGTCAIYANGAVIAASARTISVAAIEGTIGGHYKVALTAGGSQVVKLQCKSADTAVFTINLGQMRVVEAY